MLISNYSIPKLGLSLIECHENKKVTFEFFTLFYQIKSQEQKLTQQQLQLHQFFQNKKV